MTELADLWKAIRKGMGADIKKYHERVVESAIEEIERTDI